MTLADTYVLLCDWHGRVVWKSGVDDRIAIGANRGHNSRQQFFDFRADRELIGVEHAVVAEFASHNGLRLVLEQIRHGLIGDDDLHLPGCGIDDGFMKRFGVPLYEGYGLTETSPVVSLNTPQEHRAGSVGEPDPARSLDAGIVRTLWQTLDELRESSPRHRSSLVLRSVEDAAAGHSLPLERIVTDASVYGPASKPGRPA
jgi:hypothetical protein